LPSSEVIKTGIADPVLGHHAPPVPAQLRGPLSTHQLALLPVRQGFSTSVTPFLRVQWDSDLYLVTEAIEMQVSQAAWDSNPAFPGFSLTKDDKTCHKSKHFIPFDW